MAKVSPRYRRMAEVYRVFASAWGHMLDFSDGAMAEMQQHESRGGTVGDLNGYAVGKKYLNLHVTTWKQDIRAGLLFKWELYADPKFPHWWLDSVFGVNA